MMTATPFFSIIVPTRNRGMELQTCLDAIKQQTFFDYEVLIFDDGSESDIRQQHQQSLKNYDTRFQWHEVNGAGSLGSGPSVIRNIGIKKAQGDYVAFCDDDDCWHRDDHLAIAAQVLKKTKAQSYFAGMQIKDENNNIVLEKQMASVSGLAQEQASVEIEGVFSLDVSQILHFPEYAHLNIMIVARELLQKLGGFWPHTRYSEDIDLFVRVCDKAEGIMFRPEVCATHFAPANRQSPSITNQMELNDKRLLEISVFQHLLTCCTTGPALLYARKRLAVIEKKLTEELISENKMTAAKIISGAALSALPTLKWGLYALWLRLKG